MIKRKRLTAIAALKKCEATIKREYQDRRWIAGDDVDKKMNYIISNFQSILQRFSDVKRAVNINTEAILEFAHELKKSEERRIKEEEERKSIASARSILPPDRARVLDNGNVEIVVPVKREHENNDGV
jgi:hypothetical protein